MVLNCVTLSPSLSLSHNQQQEKGNAVNDDLNGIMLEGKLAVDLERQLKNFFAGKVVCQEKDMYALDCRAAARSIQDIIPRQLTTGVGGG